MIKPKGPYQVIGKSVESENFYRLQWLPFCRGLGRSGIETKENVMRLEKILTALILNQRADGVETRLASL